MATIIDRYCLFCEEETAVLPNEDPVFCSASCAGEFARNTHAWCNKHRLWFHVNYGCKKCGKESELEDLQKRQVKIEEEISRLQAEIDRDSSE